MRTKARAVRRTALVLLAAVALGPSLLLAAPKPTPADLQAGEAKFKQFCATCHGERGVGTSQGPPFVHKIYEPNHHADAAFFRAPATGVRAHHWSFGDMPKIEGVTTDDVAQIIKYIRWLQREAGIF